MTGPDRIVTPTTAADEASLDRAIRPRTLAEYVGQPRIKDNLAVFLEAARVRGEALDHVLLYGPPGLGKTTLAHVIANELGAGFKQTSGPVLERPGDLAVTRPTIDLESTVSLGQIRPMQPAFIRIPANLTLLACTLATALAAESCDPIRTFADGKQPLREIFVSPTGNNSNGNGSQANPYQTISRALQGVQPGDPSACCRAHTLAACLSGLWRERRMPRSGWAACRVSRARSSAVAQLPSSFRGDDS